MQLDDHVHPLIDTPKVTELQMLVCVGAGDVCVWSNLIFVYVMLCLLSLRLLHVGPDAALRSQLFVAQARGCSEAGLT